MKRSKETPEQQIVKMALDAASQVPTGNDGSAHYEKSNGKAYINVVKLSDTPRAVEAVAQFKPWSFSLFGRRLLGREPYLKNIYVKFRQGTTEPLEVVTSTRRSEDGVLWEGMTQDKQTDEHGEVRAFLDVKGARKTFRRVRRAGLLRAKKQQLLKF